jgi:hypothetical protein
MEVDLNGRASRNQIVNPWMAVARRRNHLHPQAQWISGFKGTGKLLLGRDLLWVGGFENDLVASSSAAPLGIWRPVTFKLEKILRTKVRLAYD